MIAWPEISDNDVRTMHAIGVASVRFNNLEQLLPMLMARYGSMRLDIAHNVAGHLTNYAKLDFVSKYADLHEEEPYMLEAIVHFVKCFRQCADNRNHLMHSMAEPTVDGNVRLNKVDRKDIGKVGVLNCEPDTVRLIADEIDATAYLGHQILNKKNFQNAPRSALPAELIAIIDAPLHLPPLPKNRTKMP